MDATSESPNNTNTEKQQHKIIDQDYFIKNAIGCWLHHFPDHKWAPIYRELQNRDFSISKEPQVVKPRRARRRKPKVST
tara:strand:+ start:1020 stop:1256 length:237 start_codon:yes stop_codon:yes gene_type:complete